jgi:hypothetical protein
LADALENVSEELQESQVAGVVPPATTSAFPPGGRRSWGCTRPSSNRRTESRSRRPEYSLGMFGGRVGGVQGVSRVAISSMVSLSERGRSGTTHARASARTCAPVPVPRCVRLKPRTTAPECVVRRDRAEAVRLVLGGTASKGAADRESSTVREEWRADLPGDLVQADTGAARLQHVADDLVLAAAQPIGDEDAASPLTLGA